MNYKNEPFLNLDDDLILRLDSIANQLTNQLASSSQSLLISEYEKFGEKEFKQFWNHIPNNNEDGNKHSKKEHKGIYCFGQFENDNLNVQYVGISQTIRRRFFKHVRTKGKTDASWAYIIAKHHNPLLNKDQRQAFIPDIQNSLIKNCRFTFVPIDSNMMLHLAEVYCANKLKSYWNSFETH